MKEILEGQYREQDGVCYFTGVPDGITPSRDRSPRDPARWSYWRRQNYAFFDRELARVSADALVLDLGAGQSDFSALLERFPKRIAADFYPYQGVTVICDLNRRLPFQEGSVDVVILSNVLEHIYAPQTLMAECRRILKPGGLLLATVPFLIGVHQRPYDFYRYTDINLRRMLHDCGFAHIAVEPVVHLGVLLYVSAAVSAAALTRPGAFMGFWPGDALMRLAVRICWKLLRMALGWLDGVFARSLPNADYPLGYLVKSVRPHSGAPEAGLHESGKLV